MATTLKKNNLAIDLRGTIDSAINAVRAVRRSETSRKQSEFQRAIADGLSYDDQLKFLEKQKELEGTLGDLGDPDFKESLDKEIATTKRLVRFNKFRDKYQKSLASLASGKTTAQSQLGMLKEQYEQTTDPELKSEILADITSTETALKRYNDTIITNQIARAEKDGSVSLINETMNLVRSKRAEAAINDNQEEVSFYDLQLTSLSSQLAQTKIADMTNDLTVRAVTRGLKATEKLDLLNQEIQSADASAPITVGNSRYNSAREYWQTVQGAYLGGAGSGLFSDFFNELSSQTKAAVDTATARDGYATEPTLNAIDAAYKQLAARPEMTLHQDKLNNTKTASMFDAVGTTAKRVLESATSGNFAAADTVLNNLSRNYGIDVTSYRTDLAQLIAQQKQSNLATGADVTAAQKIIADASKLPAVSDKSVPPTTPPAAPVSAVPEEVRSYKVLPGDTLNQIALANKTSLAQLIELNPQYRDNPNLIRPNDVVKLAPQPAPVQPAAPVATTPAPVIKVEAPKTPEPIAPTAPTSTAKSFKRLETGNIESVENGITTRMTEEEARKQGYTGN